MIKFVKGIVIFYIVLFVVYFFLSDALIKWQLEREGSRVLQAPVQIGKVTFHLLPTSLTLRDVRIGNARLPHYDLVRFEALSLPLSLRDMLAHKLIVDTAELHGLRFNRPHDGRTETGSVPSAMQSPPLREALQHVQQGLNHPLASNTIDPGASIAGAILTPQFKPVLTQITAALKAISTSSDDFGGWEIFIRRLNVDGAFDFHSLDPAGSSVRFAGTIDNVTPQPALFNTITQFDLHNVEGETASLKIKGTVDRRKLAQAALRFDLENFALTQWPLSNDPELKLIIVNASASIQAMLSLTGNQFDFNALTRFERTHFDIASASDGVSRVIADVWRNTDAFDIHLQASGALDNPVLKLNSSLDVPLASALRQLQPAALPLQSAPPPSSALFPSP